MALRKIKLGDYIYRSTANNRDLKYGTDLIVGVNSDGQISSPKGDVEGVDLSPYKIILDGAFVYNPSRLNIGSIAIHRGDLRIVSHLYIIFYLNDMGKKCIDPIWLYIYLRRKEFQREVGFRNFGSQRPEFSFDKMCDIEIPLPDIEIQKKFSNVYLSLIENQKAFARGSDDLKLACDAYIEELRRKMPSEAIGKHLSIRNEQNSDLLYGDSDVLGISQEKKIIPTKSDTKGNDISKFTIIRPDDFVYNPRNGVAVGLNKSNAIISWNNTAFYINDGKIIPEYLMMWFSRNEWDRKVKIDSWGSSTEVYSFESLGCTKIPIPSLDVQKSIVDVFKCYVERQRISESLLALIEDICPILIKGSIEEAR